MDAYGRICCFACIIRYIAAGRANDKSMVQQSMSGPSGTTKTSRTASNTSNTSESGTSTTKKFAAPVPGGASAPRPGPAPSPKASSGPKIQTQEENNPFTNLLSVLSRDHLRSDPSVIAAALASHIRSSTQPFQYWSPVLKVLYASFGVFWHGEGFESSSRLNDVDSLRRALESGASKMKSSEIDTGRSKSSSFTFATAPVSNPVPSTSETEPNTMGETEPKQIVLHLPPKVEMATINESN